MTNESRFIEEMEQDVPELFVVQAALRDWHKQKYPNATLSDIGLKLAEESGEVAKAIDRIHYAKTATEDEQWRTNLTEEIGDVAIVLMVLCCRGGLDFETTIRDRAESVMLR